MFFKCQIFIIILLLVSCSGPGRSLDRERVDTLSFSTIPLEVQDILVNNIDSTFDSWLESFFSTDESADFNYFKGTESSENWFKHVSSNYHRFDVNGKHYSLRGNKGHPFILHKGYIYFCELNLYYDDYKSREYYRIKLPK